MGQILLALPNHLGVPYREDLVTVNSTNSMCQLHMFRTRRELRSLQLFRGPSWLPCGPQIRVSNFSTRQI